MIKEPEFIVWQRSARAGSLLLHAAGEDNSMVLVNPQFVQWRRGFVYQFPGALADFFTSRGIIE